MSSSSAHTISEQDLVALNHLFDTSVSKQAPVSFKKKDLQYLTPSVKTYSQFMRFDTHSITGQHTYWRDGFLSAPIRIKPQAGQTFAGGMPYVAFKDSLLSLFQRIVVRGEGGQVLIDEQNSLAFAQHLNMLLSRDESWYQTKAPELCYARDRSVAGVSGLATTAQVAYPSGSKHAGVPAVGIAGNDGNGDSTAYNEGFADRVSSLYDQTLDFNATEPVGGYTTGFTANVKIPLRYIHDFFEQLNFPIWGLRLTFEFWINNPQTAGAFSPVCVGSSHIAGGVNVPVDGGVPTIEIDTTSADVKEPRLYYHLVEYRPEEMARVEQQMASGFTKRIVCRHHDLLNQEAPLTNVPDNKPFQYEVSSSVQAPTCVYALTFPAGHVLSADWPSTVLTGANGLTQVQLSIQGKNVYSNRLETVQEQYELLKQQMPLDADDCPVSLVTYSDFIRLNRVLAMDVSRFMSMASDPNAPVSIRLEATVKSQLGQNVDIVLLVERLVYIDLDMSSSATKVVVGNGRGQ